LAGVKGDTTARIYSICMHAQLLSIAGVHRTGEAALPETLNGRAVQARLDGDILLVEALSC
jgi:septum site-determining protein MinC